MQVVVRGAPGQGSRGGAGQAAGSSPVGQAEDEELQEGRLQQQVLVACAQIRKARDLLGPLADDLQGPREQVVELLHVPGIFLPKVGQHQLLELGGGPEGSARHIGPWARATTYSHLMHRRPDLGGERGTEIPPASCLPMLAQSPRAEAAGGSTFF